MAQGAPKGNQFWKLRSDMSEDGRKISVKDLTKKIEEYIHRCVNETLKEVDFRGKDAERVELPKMITMSIWGACVHIGISDSTWIEWRKDKKYTSIITRAETIFKAWNVEGASAGFLNSSIIARLEGLKDKQDITTNDESISDAFSGNTIIIKGRNKDGKD